MKYFKSSNFNVCRLREVVLFFSSCYRWSEISRQRLIKCTIDIHVRFRGRQLELFPIHQLNCLFKAGAMLTKYYISCLLNWSECTNKLINKERKKNVKNREVETSDKQEVEVSVRCSQRMCANKNASAESFLKKLNLFKNLPKSEREPIVHWSRWAKSNDHLAYKCPVWNILRVQVSMFISSRKLFCSSCYRWSEISTQRLRVPSIFM